MSVRALVVFVVIAAVSAFAPTGRRAPAASLKMAEEMVGATQESWILSGDTTTGISGGAAKVFDPLDMLILHERNGEVFPHPKWLRESELKHCRAAMLASVGAFSAQYGLVIPGYKAVADPVENLNQVRLLTLTLTPSLLLTLTLTNLNQVRLLRRNMMMSHLARS